MHNYNTNQVRVHQPPLRRDVRHSLPAAMAIPTRACRAVVAWLVVH